MSLLGLLALGSPAAAACEEPVTIVDFLDHANRGEAAFGAMDPDGVREAREAALETVPCVVDRITPPDAAALHRMLALSA